MIEVRLPSSAQVVPQVLPNPPSRVSESAYPTQKLRPRLFLLPAELLEQILERVPQRTDLASFASAFPELGGLVEPHVRRIIERHEQGFQTHATQWVQQIRATPRNQAWKVSKNFAEHRTAIAEMGTDVGTLTLDGQWKRWGFNRKTMDYFLSMHEVICGLLEFCPNLQSLSLADNAIMRVENIFDSLFQLPGLKYLDLSDTRLNCSHLFALEHAPIQLEGFRCINGLELAQDEGHALASFAAAHPKLRGLQLSLQESDSHLEGTTLAGENFLLPLMSIGHPTIELLELHCTPTLMTTPRLDTHLFPALKACSIQTWIIPER